MDKDTNLRNMSAPAVGSGAVADDTILKGLATYPLAAEKGPNETTEYKTASQPTDGASGRNAFK